MRIALRVFIGGLSVFCATGGLAQKGERVTAMPPPPPTQKERIDLIDVSLRSSCPRDTQGTLVLDDDDQMDLPLKLESGHGVWKERLVVEEDPTAFYATVRFPTGRTDCRKVAKVARDQTDRRLHVATFVFPACIIESVHSVNLHGTLSVGARQGIRIRYKRDLPPLDGQGVPCRGRGDFLLDARHDRDVNGLAIEDETLHLRLADLPTSLLVLSPKLPNPLLTPSAQHPGGVVFNKKVQQHAKRNGEPLSRRDITRAIDAQLVRTGQRGTMDPNAHENNDKRLQMAGLETLVLTVK